MMAIDESTPAPTTLTLQTLPTDILLSILDHLPYPSLRQLHSTNSYFAQLISPERLARSRRRYVNHLALQEAYISFQIAGGPWATPVLSRPPFNTTAPSTNLAALDPSGRFFVTLSLSHLWTPTPSYSSCNPDAVSIVSSFRDLWLSNKGVPRVDSDQESKPNSDAAHDNGDHDVTHGNADVLAPPTASSVTSSVFTLYSGPVTSTLVSDWPCYVCLLALPARCFAKKQIRGRRTFGHKHAAKRVCLDCGVKIGWYVAGMEVTCGGGLKGKGGVRTGFLRCGAGIGHFENQGAGTGESGKGCGKLSVVGPREMKRARMMERAGTIDKMFYQMGVRREMLLDCCRWKEVSEVDGEGVERSPETQASQDLATVLGNTGTMRQGRCQRCWAIDHTSREAEGTGMKGEPLCGGCLETRDIGIVSNWPVMEDFP